MPIYPQRGTTYNKTTNKNLLGTLFSVTKVFVSPENKAHMVS